MQIIYEGEHPYLRAAAAYVNRLAGDNAFWQRVAQRVPYSHTALTPPEIAQRLKGGGAMTVKIWSPSLLQQLRYRKTVAFTDRTKPHILFYHSKFLGNDVAAMVNTLVHEYVHDVDNHIDGNPAIEMGHGDNSSQGKQESAPYAIGQIAQEVYEASMGFQPKANVSAYASEGGDAADGELIAESLKPLGSFEDEAASAGIA